MFVEKMKRMPVDVDDAIAQLRNGKDVLKLKKLNDSECEALGAALAAARQVPEGLEARELSERGVAALCQGAAVAGVACVELWACRLGDSDGLVELLQQSSTLTELRLTNIMQWSEKGWMRFTEALGRCTSLRELRLYRSSVGVTMASGVSLWPALQKIDVRILELGQDLLREHDFDSIELSLPSLRELKISSCSVGVGGIGLARGISHMPELHTLELTTADLINNAAADAVWQAIDERSNIKVLDLSYNSRLDGNRFARFASRLDVLRMRVVPVTSELTVRALFERARDMVELCVMVDVLTQDLVDVLARSIAHKDCTLANLCVQLSYNKQKQWDNAFYKTIAAAVQQNTSLLSCVVEVENYDVSHVAANRDAQLIEHLCKERRDKKNSVSRAVVLPPGKRKKRGVYIAIGVAVVAAAILFGGLYYMLQKKKSNED